MKILRSILAMVLVIITAFSAVSIACFADNNKANDASLPYITLNLIKGKDKNSYFVYKYSNGVRRVEINNYYGVTDKIQLKSDAPNTTYTTDSNNFFVNKNGLLYFNSVLKKNKDIVNNGCVKCCLTVKAKGYQTTVYEIRVAHAPTKFVFYQNGNKWEGQKFAITSRNRIPVGKTKVFNFYENGYTYDVSVKSSKNKVVKAAISKNSNGRCLVLKCLKQGNSKITLSTAGGGYKYSFYVYSQRNPLTANIGVGEKLNFYRDAKKPGIKVGNTKVLKINGKVGVIGKKKGSATASVLLNKSREQIKVKVYKAPKKIVFSKSSLTLAKNKPYKLVTHVNKGSASRRRAFSSSNSKIASVTKSGVVTGKKSGVCYIYVKTYNGKVGKCKITVKGDPKKVIPAKKVVYANASLYYNYVANKNNNNKWWIHISAKTDNGVNGKFTYKSSNTNIIKVGKTGNIYVQDCIDYNGSWLYGNTAYVTITAYNGVSAKVKVIIKNDKAAASIYSTSNQYGQPDNAPPTKAQKDWIRKKLKSELPDAVETSISKKNVSIRTVYNENGTVKKVLSAKDWVTEHMAGVYTSYNGKYLYYNGGWIYGGPISTQWNTCYEDLLNCKKQGFTTHYAFVAYADDFRTTLVIW